ncbi:hypothetical protein MATL_G00021660 [Megalops atlanticus]|uniref:Wiskott-Aldrich syndrome protein family member n=1 Tax=Megalops atlanticus TaxID=7932 RepID=A0A9D3TFG3_MEGAT|nr:hypothetical protein MATL_G00021660 [Megalops atlanticus]
MHCVGEAAPTCAKRRLVPPGRCQPPVPPLVILWERLTDEVRDGRPDRRGCLDARVKLSAANLLHWCVCAAIMPLVKRNIEPRHLCRGALPEGIGSELECVTNNTLSAIIRQLSSLSKHAEDIFGELFNEANTFYLRTTSLQDRIDRLAVKVTQLDSTVEEVSLQDINMKKAFKSATIQDQQVVSKRTLSNPVVDMYNLSDKPPPLSILTPYRDDCKDGLKFYTDPSYFFDLWREKMLQDTEDKRKEKRRQKEQRRSMDGTLQREVKKVRKARNRRQEWNMMAFDKELRPDNRHSHSLHRGASSEGSLSPDSRSHSSDHTDYYPATPNHTSHAHPHSAPPPSLPAAYLASHTPTIEHDYRGVATGYQGGTLGRPHQPPPPTPRDRERHRGPPAHRVQPGEGPPISDARSDLLAAIRMGIQLKKVQEQQELQAKREPVGNDVATILSRRIAVEYSDSDDSELEENEWSD